MPVDLQIGYTSPMYREGRFAEDEPKRKRYTIGFIHFWEPEEEPPEDWEYRELFKKWEEEDAAPFTPQMP